MAGGVAVRPGSSRFLVELVCLLLVVFLFWDDCHMSQASGCCLYNADKLLPNLIFSHEAGVH